MYNLDTVNLHFISDKMKKLRNIKLITYFGEILDLFISAIVITNIMNVLNHIFKNINKVQYNKY